MCGDIRLYVEQETSQIEADIRKKDHFRMETNLSNNKRLSTVIGGICMLFREFLRENVLQ